MASCYSEGRAKRWLCKEVERLDDVTGLRRLDDIMGSGETDRGQTKWRSSRRLGRLSFSFGFKRSRAWASCGGPWAAIPPWWIVFAVRIGYPNLLVPNSNPEPLEE
jgi:hypothetical protein